MKIQRITRIQDPRAQKILELEREAFGSGAMHAYGLFPLIEAQLVYVFEDSQDILGWALVLNQIERIGAAWLFSYGVAKGHRGRGVGRQGFLLLKKELRGLGFEALGLTVEPKNQAALKIYTEGEALLQKKLVSEYYGAGEDRLFLEISLIGPGSKNPEF